MILPGLLAGCVGYHPKPLNDPGLDLLIAPPDQGRLAQVAASLRHPRLPPITIEFSKPLTEEALGVIAVLVSPDLKALRAQAQVADAQVFAAGLLPDPQFSGSLDVPTGVAADLVTAYTFGLSWDIASLVTKPIEQRIAQAEAHQVHYSIAWQEWLLAHQARLLARRVDFLQSQAKLARQAADIAAHLLEVTRRNVEQGDAKIDEFGLRQVAYLDAQDRALGFAREVEKARQELNQTLGLPPSEQFSLAPIELTPWPHANGDALFSSARRQRLDLIALQAGYESQETSLYRAILGQYPGFSIGFGAARDTSDIRSRGGNVSLDIPIFNRNRGSIAVAAATREQLYREYASRLHQTRAEIATLVIDLQRIADERMALAQELPELTRAETVLRTAVQSGDATLLGYEAVRASLLDKQLKLLSLDQATAERQIALQLAVGAPLIPQDFEP